MIATLGRPPGSGSPQPDDPATRRAWRIAGWGTVALGGSLAVLQAVGGGSGRDGLRVLLLGALVACAAGALYALVSGLVDSIRGRAVGRRRVVAATVLGVLTLVLPAMLIGVGAG